MRAVLVACGCDYVTLGLFSIQTPLTLLSQVGMFGGLRGAYYDGTSELGPPVVPQHFLLFS